MYFAIVENLPDAVVVIDRAGVIRYASPATARMFGFAPAELAGHNVSMLMGPDDARAHDDHLRRHLETGLTSVIGRTREVTGRARDGSSILIDLRAVRLEIDGEVMFLGTMRDVSDRKAREAALATLAGELHERNARLDATLDNIAEGVCFYDREQHLICFNRPYVELIRLPPSSVQPGMTLRRVLELGVALGSVDPEHAANWIEGRLALARSEQAGSMLQRMRDGRFVRITHTPLADGRSVDTFADVTEAERGTQALRVAADQASTANRAKSEFLANMSHELRTPLNAIIGFSEVIRDQLLGPIGPSKYREYAADIHQSGQLLLSIISDILDMSKIEAGRYEIREGTFDIADVVGTCVTMVDTRAREGGIRLENRIAGSTVRLRGDERAVKQAVLNLLSNAVKFTRAGGTVIADARLESTGSVALTISDTGVGIAAADLDRIFEPFHQVDSSYRRAQEGVGLGLSISKRLIEFHDGHLQIDSEVGRGTAVTIRFPASRVLLERHR
jgi:PAS domain S-box-containing protein